MGDFLLSLLNLTAKRSAVFFVYVSALLNAGGAGQPANLFKKITLI